MNLYDIHRMPSIISKPLSKITDVALLIPSFPRDYHYLYKLLVVMKTTNVCIDTYIIFTNQEEYSLFEMKDRIKHYVIGDELNRNSITTSKKFFGLKQLMKLNYKYIICCDSEIEIVPENFTSENIISKIEDIFRNKRIYAGYVKGSYDSNIMSISATLFPNEYETLRQRTDTFAYSFWWSDLPVYRTKDLKGFFEKIDYSNIVWDYFEYLIYQFYLILTDGFYILNTTAVTGMNKSLEGLNTSDLNILDNLSNMGVGFSWVINRTYLKNKEYFNSRGTFIRFHLDWN